MVSINRTICFVFLPIRLPPSSSIAGNVGRLVSYFILLLLSCTAVNINYWKRSKLASRSFIIFHDDPGPGPLLRVYGNRHVRHYIIIIIIIIVIIVVDSPDIFKFSTIIIVIPTNRVHHIILLRSFNVCHMTVASHEVLSRRIETNISRYFTGHFKIEYSFDLVG